MKRPYKYLLLILWLLLIFYLSSEGDTASSGRSDLVVEAIRTVVHTNLSTDILTFIARKAAHTVAYLVLGVLMYNVVRSYNTSTRKAILLSVALVCSYAISDEVHQLFVGGRSGEVRDVLIDTSAGAVGVLGVSWAYHKRKPLSRLDT